MSDLVTFVRARLDEDEQVANDNDGDTWIAGDETVYAIDGGGPVVLGLYGYLGVAGDHIARHDPARVLREVEAKRATIGWCVEVIGERDLSHYGQSGALKDDREALAVTLAVETLRLLALPYNDHPDYQATWAP